LWSINPEVGMKLGVNYNRERVTRGRGERGRWGIEGRNGPNNICTSE
jgi:hypothetical protein